MSVANDALKSVNEIQENKPLVSVSHLEFRPAVPVKEDRQDRQEIPGTRLTLPSLLYAFVLFTFLILGVLLLRTINHRIQARAAAAPSPAASGVVSGSDAPAPAKPASQSTTPPVLATTSPSPASPTTPSPAAYTAPTPPPAQPTYRLQAVFFSPTSPSAIVGGKTVFVGDHVGPYRVTRINPTSVSLANGDQIRVLHLQ